MTLGDLLGEEPPRYVSDGYEVYGQRFGDSVVSDLTYVPDENQGGAPPPQACQGRSLA